jgi:hypothetical protein
MSPPLQVWTGVKLQFGDTINYSAAKVLDSTGTGVGDLAMVMPIRFGKSIEQSKMPPKILRGIVTKHV